MRKWLQPRFLTGAGLFVAGLAWASPWDIDMIDSRAFKTFEWAMRPPRAPEAVQTRVGAIPRPGAVGTYQNDYIAPVDRVADGDRLTNPYAVDTATIVKGATTFQITCAPCHGPEGKGGGPVTHNDPSQNIARFPIPAPMLSGPGAVSAMRADGYIYGTIRNGGALMPAYGVSLTDRERWAVVAYIRTLEGGAYVPPAPAGAPQ